MKLNEPTVLKVRQHTVIFDKKVPPVKVMTTGDWHISPIISSRQADFLKEAISVVKPDAIILQGDIVDSPMELKRDTSLKKLETELKICSKFAPTMLVLGSHDFITPTKPAHIMKDFSIPCWKEICKKCHVKLLMDESYEPIPGVVFYGLFQDERTMIELDKTGQKKHCDSASGFLAKIKEADFELDKTKVNWFISHAPLLDKRVARELSDFDILSFGHTHGGIVPRGLDEIFAKLNINGGLVSTSAKPFPRMVRGTKILNGDTLLLINSGMTGAQFCAPKLLQNLNFVKASEISVVEIKNKTD